MFSNDFLMISFLYCSIRSYLLPREEKKEWIQKREESRSSQALGSSESALRLDVSFPLD